MHHVIENAGVIAGGAEARIDAAVVTLARLIGRRIARDHFEAIRAANDNAPEKDAGGRYGAAGKSGRARPLSRSTNRRILTVTCASVPREPFQRYALLPHLGCRVRRRGWRRPA